MERRRAHPVPTPAAASHRAYAEEEQLDEMSQKTEEWAKPMEEFCYWGFRVSQFRQPSVPLDEPSIRAIKQQIRQTWSRYLAPGTLSPLGKSVALLWMGEAGAILPTIREELSQRMREIEDRCALLEKTVASVLERVVEIEGILEQQRTVLTKEQRRKRLDVLFERAMEAAVEIEERYGDPVELLTTLLPLSEEEARKLERE